MGDLIVTCWSKSGRNRRCGELSPRERRPPRRWREIGMVVEGLTTAPVLRDLSHRLEVEMPITEGVCTVLDGVPLERARRDADAARPDLGVSAELRFG